MKTEHKPFMAITADIADSRLERLAQDKGVATLVRPGQQVADPPAPKAEPELDPESIPTPRSQMKNLNIEVPDYLWKELRVGAVHRGTTIRHVIMNSLRLEGFEIRDADMIEDGRRTGA